MEYQQTAASQSVLGEHAQLGDQVDIIEKFAYGVDDSSSFFDLSNVSYNSNFDPMDFDEEATDNEDEEVIMARQQIILDKRHPLEYEQELGSLQRIANRKGDNISSNSCDDEECDSDELDSPNCSDDEDEYGYLVDTSQPRMKKKKRETPNISSSVVGMHDDYFYLGQKFENAVQFRKAVTTYCMLRGRDVDFKRNEKTRVSGKCSAVDCPWYIWASLDQGSFTIKTYVPTHTCGRLARVKKLRAKWIAETYHKKFSVNPYLKLREIVDTLWDEYGVKTSLVLALKAMRIAQNAILGEYKEQYNILHRYVLEIKKSNPRNTVKLKLNDGVFQRIYICFDAIKKGYLGGCRPFFGVDGCFLKGPFGGQLLVVVGRDGNNQMFPIAWACVEVEDTESWVWFLENLANDLETVDGFGFTIMSNQQKGLLAAISEVFSMVEKRICARHVYMNFRSIFGGGLEFRRCFWKIAKSTTENDFNKNMEAFSDLSKLAEKDLKKRNYRKWVKAYQEPFSKCDSVDNNMNEVFNSYILSSRHKPLITMLEDIREGIMERIHKKRDYLANKQVYLCPRIQEKLEKSKILARGWLAFWDGNFSYGVRQGSTQVRYVVNLGNKTCSCKAWQLSGIPCNHAIAAIWKANEIPEHYVEDCYKKVNYLKAYSFPLEPLNGPQMWPNLPYDPIIAPPLKKLKNRPTVKRKSSTGEVDAIKLSRKGQIQKCGECGGQGHNKRGCPNRSDLNL